LADEAAARLRASLAETPGDIEARLILAQAQFERGAITEAGALLDEAANLGPDRFDVRLRRGEFFARLGIYQRAFAELDAARRLPVPDFASLLYCEELRRWVAERARLAVLREPALPPAPRWLRSLAHRVWPWHRQPEGQLR
jgi:tetratricopeptide (TPR) repeat protein